MQTILFLWLYVIALICFGIMVFYNKDADIKIIAAIPSFIILAVLTISAYSLEITTLDDTTDRYLTYTYSDQGVALITFMLTIISFLYGVVTILDRTHGLISEASRGAGRQR